MTQEPYGQWMGTPMNDRDVERLLTSTGWGILSLADDDEPYSIPVSFGYGDGNVYFAFIRDSPTNTKFRFIDGGKTARLLVTAVRGRFDWQSVAVTGPVRAIDRSSESGDRLIEVLDENAWFSSDFERSSSIGELHGWRLEPDEMRGLEVRPDES